MNENREQLLDAAQKTFAQFGYKKTTLDDIAKLFGKGKTSIYYYFQGKDEVYRAVLEREMGISLGAINQNIDTFHASTEKVKAYVATRMVSIGSAPVLFDASTNDATKHLPVVSSVMLQFDKARQDKLQRILEEGMENGSFKEMDAQLASMAIETALKGLELHFSNGAGPDNIDQRIDNLMQLLFYGLVNQ
ncbi:MAG: TetR/AcrR family transcriptional regulator [Breznakibacter sp.]